MKTLNLLALTIACAVSASASAACFTVLGKDGQTIFQSDTTPVDLSMPLHETVPARFDPGASMVFSMDTLATDCIPVGAKSEAQAKRGDDVMSTVFANVRPLQRISKDTDTAVPAKTFPGPGPEPSAKTSQRY